MSWSLTPSDLDELQRLLEDAHVANKAEFDQMRELPDLPGFVRSLVGLDRRAAQAAFNNALADITMTTVQIRFVEMIVDHLTATGRMEPELLYAPPFTDDAPNGVSDIFPEAAVEKIVGLLGGFAPRLAV